MAYKSMKSGSKASRPSKKGFRSFFSQKVASRPSSRGGRGGGRGR